MGSQSYQLFLDTLHTKEPNKKVLMNQLTELLCIEKEAVYRRLRKDVAFSFAEIELIAKKYQISLDYIIGNSGNKNDMIFYLIDYDFIETLPEHLEYTKNHIQLVSSLKDDPNSEIGFAMNTFPLSLVKSREHRHIYHLALYKWMYQYGKSNNLPHFCDFTLPDQLLEFNDQYRRKITHADYTYYIFDENMLNCVVKDILYFRMIEFISKKEMEILKQELFDFLNYLEEIAIKGKFKSGKRVDFFVTQMSIETSYCYIDSINYSGVSLKLFNLNDATSTGSQNIPRIKEWLRSLKKCSSQISVSGELQRIKYFDKQREIISQL